jgi:hypothetical protein
VANVYSQGGNNFDDDGTCNPIGGNFTQSSSLLLGPLGSYGGPTQTFPLLPGSAAIGAGLTYTSYTTTTDQRGMGRIGPIDVGSFESQGFSLAQSGGDNQSALVNTAFATPFSVTVTAKNPVEPVNGGRVVFTPPASGASAAISGSPATISGGGPCASLETMVEDHLTEDDAKGGAIEAPFCLEHPGWRPCAERVRGSCGAKLYGNSGLRTCWVFRRAEWGHARNAGWILRSDPCWGDHDEIA